MTNPIKTPYEGAISNDASLPLIGARLLCASLAHVIAWNPHGFIPEKYKSTAQQYSINQYLKSKSESSTAFYHAFQVYNIAYNSTLFPIIDRYLKHPARKPIIEAFNVSPHTASVCAATLSYAIIPSLLLYNDIFSKEARTVILKAMNSSVVASKNFYFYSSNVPALLGIKSAFCITDILIQRFFDSENAQSTSEILSRHFLLGGSSLCLIYFGLNQDNLKCHIIKSFISNTVEQYNLNVKVPNIFKQSDTNEEVAI